MITPKEALEQAVSFARQVACIEGVRRSPEMKAIAEQYQAIFEQALASLQGEDAVERVARIKAAVTKHCHVNMKWPATAQIDDIHIEEFLSVILATGLVPDEADHGAVRTLSIGYTNHRGETSTRNIIPRSVRFGSTKWHPEEQWLLLAWDNDKQADREFALKDFGSPESAIRADEREKCAKVAVARSDAVMAEAEAAHDDDNYDLYERLECEAGNYMGLAAAIRSGGGE